MREITKIINFRVPFSVYEQYQKETIKKKMSMTDCILKKLDTASKVTTLNNRIHELENSIHELEIKNKVLMEASIEGLSIIIKLINLPALSEEQWNKFTENARVIFDKLKYSGSAEVQPDDR